MEVIAPDSERGPQADTFIKPSALTLHSASALTVTIAALIVTPVVSIVILLSPTFSVMDCMAEMVLEPASTDML